MFWTFFFLTIIISLPFILIYFAIRNFGIANTMNGLTRLQDNVKEYERLLKIVKHIAEQAKVVLEDLKFVQDNVQKLQNSMVNNTLNRFAVEGKQVELTEDEDRICTIFAEKRLTKLSEDFVKLADRLNGIATIKINRQNLSKLDKYFGMTDAEIVESFVSKEDQEWCRDLDFVVKYIEKV